MKFLIGEGGWSYLERLAYRGFVGILYDNTWTGVLTYIILALVVILALIGLFTVLRWIFGGKKKNKSKDPYKDWIKTGKY